jgi:DNA-binding NarL/FixJ family response regulator
MSKGLQVILADDHPLFRGALRAAITGMDPDATIIECGDFDAARKALNEHADADIVLLDLSMPGVSGLSGLMHIKANNPTIPVAMVSAAEDVATIRRALDLGASGYISKSSTMDQMRDAIRTILDGGIVVPPHISLDAEDEPEMRDLIKRLKSLTRQQARVLGMLTEGLLNKQIAYELDVSEATVKAHVSAILQKLGVESRTRAVIRFARISNMDEHKIATAPRK